MYRENSYFVSLLGLGSDLNSLLPWPGNLEQSCDSLSMNFQNDDVPVFYQDQFSDYVFEDWVELTIPGTVVRGSLTSQQIWKTLKEF